MFVNLKFERRDMEHKVVVYKTASLDLATTTPAVLGYFTSHGWMIVDYSDERRG